jgi:hypothetical protein
LEIYNIGDIQYVVFDQGRNTNRSTTVSLWPTVGSTVPVW